jgi:peptide/nickel transport system substrate-binding protein
LIAGQLLPYGSGVSANKVRRRPLAVAAALVIAVLAGLTGPLTAKAATANTTLRVEADTSFSTFNPFLAYFAADLQVIDGIYPMLTQSGENGQPEPYLATSWTISPDHLTWTFRIRQGLKWSDGVPITAADIAWTYNLVAFNSVGGTANGSLLQDVKSVTAPNAATLVITTNTPESNMAYNGAIIPVVPEHIWKSRVPDLANFRNMSSFPVVGYGPWTLTGYVPNQYATLTANKSFYSGAPAFATLVIQYFSNSDAAVAALRTGALQEIDNLSATEYEALKGRPGIGVYPSLSNIWDAIELNTGARTRSGSRFGNGNPALADPVVRKAIALAINRPELVAKVLDGLGVAGAGYLPPAYPQWWWTPSAGQAENYDPAEANALLNAAGFKMGPGGVRIDPVTHQPLVFRFGIHSDEITDSEIAPYLVDWMQAIGIKLNVQAMSFTQLNTELPKGDWDILMDSWDTGADPTYLLSVQTCATLPLSNGTAGNTDAFFCDPRYDQLYAQQLTEFSQQQRAATVDAMQSLLYGSDVDIILYYSDTLSAVRSSQVSGFFYGGPNGQGFYPVQNDYINWLIAKPVAVAAGSSSSAGLYIGLPVAVVVVLGIGVVFALRRRATADDRE